MGNTSGVGAAATFDFCGILKIPINICVWWNTLRYVDSFFLKTPSKVGEVAERWVS